MLKIKSKIFLKNPFIKISLFTLINTTSKLWKYPLSQIFEIFFLIELRVMSSTRNIYNFHFTLNLNNVQVLPFKTLLFIYQHWNMINKTIFWTARLATLTTFKIVYYIINIYTQVLVNHFNICTNYLLPPTVVFRVTLSSIIYLI